MFTNHLSRGVRTSMSLFSIKLLAEMLIFNTVLFEVDGEASNENRKPLFLELVLVKAERNGILLCLSIWLRNLQKYVIYLLSNICKMNQNVSSVTTEISYKVCVIYSWKIGGGKPTALKETPWGCLKAEICKQICVHWAVRYSCVWRRPSL